MLCAAYLTVLAGCSQAVGDSTPAALRPLPKKMMLQCQQYAELRPACPTEVPIAHDDKPRARSNRTSGEAVFFAEWNAPTAELSADNAPPRFTHINLFAGELDPLPSPFESLGPRTWEGRTGELWQGPAYQLGGAMEADHLIFRWTEDGTDYSLSLHGWEPIEQTEATLNLIVQSIP